MRPTRQSVTTAQYRFCWVFGHFNGRSLRTPGPSRITLCGTGAPGNRWYERMTAVAMAS
jgi:hypothetical protein